MPISVRLPDDSVREMPDGATGTDLAKGISPRLLDAAFAIRVDGRLQDLGRLLQDGSQVAVVTTKDPESLDWSSGTPRPTCWPRPCSGSSRT